MKKFLQWWKVWGQVWGFVLLIALLNVIILNNDIQSIAGVSRTETFISLDQQIERQIKI